LNVRIVPGVKGNVAHAFWADLLPSKDVTAAASSLLLPGMDHKVSSRREQDHIQMNQEVKEVSVSTGAKGLR
jgi:hypothetical protein